MPFGLPSLGQAIQFGGQLVQSAENLVTQGVNSAIDAIQTIATAQPRNATIMDPSRPAAGAQQVQGAVSVEDFQRFKDAVVQGFHSVREDLASIRAYGAAGEGGLYDSVNGGGGGGLFGGGGSNSNLLLILLLSQGTLGTSTLSSNPLLLLLLLGGNGGGSGGGLDLGLAAAFGLI